MWTRKNTHGQARPGGDPPVHPLKKGIFLHLSSKDSFFAAILPVNILYYVELNFYLSRHFALLLIIIWDPFEAANAPWSSGKLCIYITIGGYMSIEECMYTIPAHLTSAIHQLIDIFTQPRPRSNNSCSKSLKHDHYWSLYMHVTNIQTINAIEIARTCDNE